jgi:outer membrane protein
MKKSILSLLLLLGFSMSVCAQKIVLIDTEYILRMCLHIRKLLLRSNRSSKKWQAEVEALSKEAKTMYTNYQTRDASYSCSEDKLKRMLLLLKKRVRPI